MHMNGAQLKLKLLSLHVMWPHFEIHELAVLPHDIFYTVHQEDSLVSLPSQPVHRATQLLNHISCNRNPP